VVVELIVVHDGTTDLPSASEHMKRRMEDGKCRIPVHGGGSLNPDPRSVNVHHKFAAKIAPTPYDIFEPTITPKCNSVFIPLPMSAVHQC